MDLHFSFGKQIPLKKDSNLKNRYAEREWGVGPRIFMGGETRREQEGQDRGEIPESFSM